MKKPPREARQKAIDGILFGDKPIAQQRTPVAGRLKRPSSISPAVPKRQVDTIEAARKLKPTLPQSSEAFPLSGLNLDLDDEVSSSRRRKKSKASKNSKEHRKGIRGFFGRKWQAIRGWSTKKKILVGILIFVVIVAIVGGLLFLKGYLNARKVFRGGGSAVSLTDAAPELLKGEGDGRINILLLGVGGEGHEAPDLTDTVMIASIDPVNKKTALLSIPRDLWVKVPQKGSMKLNAVYETGKYDYLGRQNASNADQKAVDAGFKATSEVLEDALGIPIHYHVLVNFKAFQQAIDTVGGIDVNVPERLYDPTMARENNWNPVIAEAGQQHFDGQKALMYVRSRYTTSDFDRSERQRAVIVALQQKVLSLGTFSNPQKISQLMDAFGNNVTTDLSLKDVSRLYQITKGITPDKITSVGLTDPDSNFLTTDMISGQSVVVPTAGVENYDEIRSFVRNTMRDGYLAKENATVMVLNGTEAPGLAAEVAAVLKSYGYTLGVVGDAPTKTYDTTTIIDMSNGKNPYTAQYLKKRFDLKNLSTKLPDTSIQTQNADFVIILGKNETVN